MRLSNEAGPCYGACMIRSQIIAAALLLGCAAPPDPGSPEATMARIAPCIDAADGRCLFRELDRASRWAVGLMHRTLGEIRALADGAYPPERRGDAFGSFAPFASASDPASLFAAYCEQRRCLAAIARGLGAVAGVAKTGPDRVEVTTTRGARFVLVRADGRFGLALFHEDLEAAKIRLLDRKKQVEWDAAAFREQQRAIGGIP